MTAVENGHFHVKQVLGVLLAISMIKCQLTESNYGANTGGLSATATALIGYRSGANGLSLDPFRIGTCRRNLDPRSYGRKRCGCACPSNPTEWWSPARAAVPFTFYLFFWLLHHAASLEISDN